MTVICCFLGDPHHVDVFLVDAEEGFRAINVNVIARCIAKLLFTNVVAKWHGSTHDSAAFYASMLNILLESGGGGEC